MGSPRKRLTKLARGLSEAVVIMVVIMVAVTLGFGIKSWYDSQMRRLPATEMATAEWTATFSGGRWIASLRVNNNLDRSISLEQVRVTVGNGTVYTIPGATAWTPTPSLPQTMAMKSSTSIVLTSTGVRADTPPTVVEVLVRDPASGATQWIRAVGGVSI